MNQKTFFSYWLLAVLAASPLWAAPSQLHVSGNQILTDAGCTIRLKGVNVDGMEFDPTGNQGPTGEGITATVAEAVTAWHANILRIPMNQDYWFGCGGSNAVTYQTVIQEIVNYCSANGAYVLLDLHWSGNQTGATSPCGGAGWGNAKSDNCNGGCEEYMPDDNSVTFWSSVAGTSWIQNNSAVLFDLYNEPHDYNPDGWTIWLNGGTDNGFHTPGMQGLLNTIRTAGAQNIVVAGGLDYAYDLTGMAYSYCGGSPCALTDSTGDGVIYSTHIYPNKGSNPWTKNDGESKISPAAVYYPVIVGEFGQGNAITGYTPNPDPTGTWDQTLLGWLDGGNAVSYFYNYTAWDMHDGSCPCLISNWSYTPTSYHGVPVMNDLATPVATCPPTSTPTATATPCGYPGNTCTPTDTPTATATPVLGDNIPWPNPWDGSQPVSFYHLMATTADSVHLKAYTLSFRKIYDDGTLSTAAGHPIYSVSWDQLGGNLANGLYYLVLEESRGGNVTRTILKLLVER